MKAYAYVILSLLITVLFATALYPTYSLQLTSLALLIALHLAVFGGVWFIDAVVREIASEIRRLNR